MAKINITINQLGEAKIDVQGAAGRSCESMTKAIEVALTGGDGKVVSKEFKPEHNTAPTETGQSVQQRW